MTARDYAAQKALIDAAFALIAAAQVHLGCGGRDGKTCGEGCMCWYLARDQLERLS